MALTLSTNKCGCDPIHRGHCQQQGRRIIALEKCFGRLKAKDGVFSILGNHDYGDYVQWNNRKEKEDNQNYSCKPKVKWDLRSC